MNVASSQQNTVPVPLPRARKAAFRTRQAVEIVVAAAVSLLSLAAGAPAFAMTVAPGGGATSGLTIPPGTATVSAGLATWQVALIAAGAALFGAAIVLLARRLRPAHRPVTALGA